MRLVSDPRCTSALVSTFNSMMLPLQAATGFVSCALYVGAEDPDTLCYTEEWQTPEDLDREIRSIRYTHLLAVMEKAAERPDFQLYWVSDVKGMEYLEKVRLCRAS